MDLFLPNYINIIDKKSSPSVPALFRVAPSNHILTDRVVYPSFLSAAIETFSMKRMERLYDAINILNSHPDECDAFADTRLRREIHATLKKGAMNAGI